MFPQEDISESILTLLEYEAMADDVEKIDAVMTEEIYDAADSYDIVEDVVSDTFTLTIYNDVGVPLLVVKNLDDYDVIEAYLEDEFDLEELDPDDVDRDSVATHSNFGH